MFDTRIKSGDSLGGGSRSYCPRAEAVRDVQFDPFNAEYFSAISENGALTLWDRRMEDSAVIKLIAHTSAGVTLAYHPKHEGVVATGGKDKYVKIWNLYDPLGSCNFISTPDLPGSPSAAPDSSSIDNATKTIFIPSKPLATVRTPGQVSRIKWRAGSAGRRSGRFESQLATCSADRGEILIWNLNLPHMPVCVLSGHSETCTDFEWVDTLAGENLTPWKRVCACIHFVGIANCCLTLSLYLG